MEYRIREYLGLFTIQAFVKIERQEGWLWWKRIYTEERWVNVSDEGKLCIDNGRRFSLYCAPPMEPLKSLEEAMDLAHRFKRGANYITV